VDSRHWPEGYVNKRDERKGELSLENGWAVGISQSQGLSNMKTEMEDVAIVIDNFGKDIDPSKRVFIGVYDGHNGKLAADFVSATLHTNILEQLRNHDRPVEESLTLAYEYTDKMLSTLDVKFTGSTAVTCLSTQKGNQHTLITANVGDSRAVLSREGKATRLTYDHKAKDPQEVERVQSIGGFFVNNRLEGVLAITRAFGDTKLKEFAVATPHISEIEIKTSDDLLIIASDGLWDVIRDQEAVDLIITNTDAKQMSKILVDEALSRGSMDDITVVVARKIKPLLLT